jgi:hypothetical protein
VDHKTYFLVCGEETEELYQALKSRLIDELRIIDSDLKLVALIDMTDPEVKRSAEQFLDSER